MIFPYLNNGFIQSAPFKIMWAGFESTTLRLQNNGWTLAVEDLCDYVLDRHLVRFILRHEMLNLYCLTNREEIEFAKLMEWRHPLSFNISCMARDICYTTIPEFNLTKIMEFDAHPEYVDLREKSIKDLSIFRTLVQPENALIIEPDKISDLLQKIVEAQSPKQKEIRERMKRMEIRDMKQTLHAQILSIAA